MGSSLVRETLGDQARRNGRSCAAKPASRQTNRQARGEEVVACLRETT